MSRGALKLEKGLAVFNVDVKDRVAMDLGASTGGFTDVLFTDAFSLLQFLDDMSDDEHNRFTKRDIMDAMQFYQENYVTYSRSEAERVSAIPMPANKRNYQKQADHLEEARAIRDIRMKRQDRDWREGNGRPKGSGEKSKIVEEWQRQHPDGKKADCIRETGLSKPTVYKWWK